MMPPDRFGDAMDQAGSDALSGSVMTKKRMIVKHKKTA